MSEAQSRGDYRHVIDLAVRWGDVDMLGYVHNASILYLHGVGAYCYFESRVGASPRPGEGRGLILAGVGCDFLAQLYYLA